MTDRIGGLEEVAGQWEWRRQTRRGKESTALDSLCDIVVNVKLSAVPGKWVWKPNASGLFYVSSLCLLIANSMVEEVNSAFA